ncbi:MAG: DUF6390 family protein [Candidatus Micrarchaeota archaeon]
MDSTLFSGCYAFPPNNLGYCGGNSFTNVIQSCLNRGKTTKKLERELKKFKAHYAYLSLIARENNLKPFDLDVVNAFWIGNSLLENVPYNSLQKFLTNNLFPKNSVRGKFLARNLPKGLVPHHSFNSLYVNFVTEKVAKTKKNFDSCCVTSGKILSVTGKKAKINRFSISGHGKLTINRKISTIDLVRNSVQFTKPKKGDIIAVHWGMAVDKLSKEDENLLLKYTQKNIDVLNAFRKF